MHEQEQEQARYRVEVTNRAGKPVFRCRAGEDEQSLRALTSRFAGEDYRVTITDLSD